MIKKLFFIVLLTSGCEPGYFLEDVPSCIQKRINNFNRVEACDEGASVYEYFFQGETVYVFSMGDCGADQSANVYDTNCNRICTLGGFTGNLECNGEVFGEKASNKKLVWHN